MKHPPPLPPEPKIPKAVKAEHDSIPGQQRVSARVIMHSAVLFGRLSLVAFVLFIVGGPFNMVKVSLQASGWLAWDALLLFFFSTAG